MVQWLGNLSHHQKTLLSLQKYPLWSSGQDFFTFPLVRGPYLYRLRYMIRIGGRRVILVFRVASLWLQLSHRFSLVLSGTNFPLFSSTFYHYLKVLFCWPKTLHLSPERRTVGFLHFSSRVSDCRRRIFLTSFTPHVGFHLSTVAKISRAYIGI